ncbi:MAG: T9SS type A sorting domain-containing protein [Rubricoccaceae bacterium]|nr:T9SS type A sorting domain-containing protein [Rubricoccaceae bacterium]
MVSPLPSPARGVLTLVALLLGTSAGSAQAPFLETDGLLVIEAETEVVPGDGYPEGWRHMPLEADADHPAFPGATGGEYLQWDGGNQYNAPGQGTIAFPIEVRLPGTYRFQWRSRTGYGSDPTEHNDSWLKIDADAFYGERDGHIVCPKGYDPQENDCTGDEPNGSGSDGWFKAYLSGATDWTWSTRTSDNDPHDLYARFDAPGRYTLRVSGRSDGHALDRLVLFHSTVPQGQALDLTNPESPRGTDGVTVAVTRLGPGTLGAEGGPMPFEATLTAGADTPFAGEAWVSATLPDGSSIGPLFGPRALTLAGGGTVTRTLTLDVPGAAPAGLYAVTVYAGARYPDAVDASASFTFRKEGALAGGPALLRVAEPEAAAGVPLLGLAPNPTRGRAAVRYAVDAPGPVRVAVHDVLGREVAVLADGAHAAGPHTAVLSGDHLPSGVYVVRVEAGGGTATERITLAR